LIVTSTFACGGPGTTDVQAQSADVGAVLADLDRYLDEIDCEAGDLRCSPVTLSFEPTRSAATSGGQTILIIDRGIEPIALLKYRRRVKDMLQLDETGRLRRSEPTVRVPAYVDELFERLADRGFISAAKLQPLADRLEPVLREFEREHGGAHGKIPFQFLAEHNPRADFVVLSSPSFPDLFRREFCAGDADAFGARVAEAAADIREHAIRSHGVGYVNYSAGVTPQSIQADFSRLCGGYVRPRTVDRLVNAHLAFYEALFATPGVLGVQAGTDGQIGETPLDCAVDLPRRIRAGYFLALDSRLGPDGQRGRGGDLDASIPAGQSAVKRCLDVLVNFGVKDRRPFPYNDTPYQIADAFGLSAYPINFGHTSWAAPLALSRLIHIVESRLGGRLDDEAIATAKALLTPDQCQGPCQYQDPLLHHQLELFRLGL
jgi:hypothetical protein